MADGDSDIAADHHVQGFSVRAGGFPELAQADVFVGAGSDLTVLHIEHDAQASSNLFGATRILAQVFRVGDFNLRIEAVPGSAGVFAVGARQAIGETSLPKIARPTPKTTSKIWPVSSSPT